MSKGMKSFVQILFLSVFFALMVTGKAQIWMGLIFTSVILSAFFGRFYCGWICPINTIMRPFVWLSKKLGIQKKEVPEALRTGMLRLIAFGFFLVGLGYTIYTITQGRKFPLPLIIIPLGVITAFFINEKSWHRYLCPWGVFFSLTGRFSKRGIKSKGCVGCFACEKVCPGDAIKVEKGKETVIDPTHCLLCMECTTGCPVNALDYKK